MEGFESKSHASADPNSRAKRKKKRQEEVVAVVGTPSPDQIIETEPSVNSDQMAVFEPEETVNEPEVCPPDWIAPEGFRVDNGRITEVEDDVFVASPPFFVVAFTCDDRKRNYGRMLMWRNVTGDWEEWVMPMPALDGSMKELRAVLLRAGLNIGYSKAERDALREYIRDSKPIRRITSTTRNRLA